MELTRRVYRRLRLICGNIARTLNPASFKHRVSGLVERWVRGSLVDIKDLYSPLIIKTDKSKFIEIESFETKTILKIKRAQIKDLKELLCCLDQKRL